jgi:hypothetical protein
VCYFLDYQSPCPRAERRHYVEIHCRTFGENQIRALGQAPRAPNARCRESTHGFATPNPDDASEAEESGRGSGGAGAIASWRMVDRFWPLSGARS